MDTNVTIIPNICQYAYNRTDIKSCIHECVCDNLNTDLDCGNVTNTLFCNRREDHDFSVAVYGTYGLLMIIAIAALIWHIKSRIFIDTFLKTQNDLKNNQNSQGPTFIAKLLTMHWCKKQTRSEFNKDLTNEQKTALTITEKTWPKFHRELANIKKGNLKVEWKWSRFNVQFWIKIIIKNININNRQIIIKIFLSK